MNNQGTTFPRQLFVTGTDTGIGKTVTAAMLTLGLRGGYWKPIQSGLESPTDTEWVKEATGLGEDHFFPESYRLQQPLSPHTSAARDGVRIETESITLPEQHNLPHLIIEGAGGIMVPLNEQTLMIDLIRQLNIPALIVAKSGLGTINHTLLTIHRLRDYSIPLLGVVLNGEKNPDNKKAIETYGQTKVIAEIEPLPTITPFSLEQRFDQLF